MFLERIPVRLRLSLGHAMFMAVLFICFGYGLYRVVEHNLYQSVDAALLTSARSIRDARFVRGFSPPFMERFLQRFLGEKYVRPYAQLVDLSGNVSELDDITGAVKSRNDQRVNLPVSQLALSRSERGLETTEFIRSPVSKALLRQVTVPVMKYGRFTRELIQVAAPLESTTQTLGTLSRVLWISVIAASLLAIVFGYVWTGRAFKPVKLITTAASSMGSDDLSMRLPISAANDELRGLAKTFNAMFDRLEESFGRLRRFTGDVSHELRTPLAVLRGEADLALRRDRSADDYRKALTTIRSEAKGMTIIIEDLLLLARAESQSVAMSWLDIDVAAFLNELKATVKPIFQEKHLELVFNYPPQITFRGNHGYLLLALKNLLLNAAKHSVDSSRVEFSVATLDTLVVFQVRDFGEGIPQESLPHIFETFYRADTARNRGTGGTGIGLSLALALVKLHKGRIDVTSKITDGSEFVVSIPRDIPAEHPTPVIAKASVSLSKTSAKPALSLS
jgi:heavy metal sensor kinase